MWCVHESKLYLSSFSFGLILELNFEFDGVVKKFGDKSKLTFQIVHLKAFPFCLHVDNLNHIKGLKFDLDLLFLFK